MIWPFKKKNKLIKSTGGVMTEYNRLRASVGMAPARDDDCYEAVAWVVMFDLLAPEVAEECEQLPFEERGLFMMVYATYLSWLAMKGVESHFPKDSWRLILPMIQREFSKKPWYQPEVMNRLFHSMVVDWPIGEGKGRHTGVPAGPWFDAVMAANFAGVDLRHSTNPRFILYVTAMSNEILKTIAKMAPAD